MWLYVSRSEVRQRPTLPGTPPIEDARLNAGQAPAPLDAGNPAFLAEEAHTLLPVSLHRLTGVLLLLALGCVPTRAAIGTDAAQPIPAEFASQVERAERLGKELFVQDVFSARATDVMMEAKILPGDEALRGWLTVPSEDGGRTVLWISETGAGLGLSYELTFPPGSDRESDLERYAPPRPLDAQTLGMFKARETAIKRLTEVCGTGINPVILPAALIGQEGWLVYLLGGSNRKGEVVLAGHRLFRISADGARVEEEVPLSRSCLVDRVEEEKGEVQAMMVTHGVTPYPVETHVFTALLYGMELFVTTDRGLWKVDLKGSITFMQAP